MGLLQTDMQYEHARSLITSLSNTSTETSDRINSLVKELVSECRRDLEKDGVPTARQEFQRIAECRYHGQGFELRAPIPDVEIVPENITSIMVMPLKTVKLS